MRREGNTELGSSKLWALLMEADCKEITEGQVMNWQVNFSLNKSKVINRVEKNLNF